MAIPQHPFVRQPQVIYNPNYDRQQSFRSGSPQPETQEPIDAQLARAMLNEGGVSEEHAARLRGILGTSGNRETRQQMQAAADRDINAFARAASDPHNPLTVAEADEAWDNLRRQHGVKADIVGRPMQLYKAAEQESNPLIDQVSKSKALAQAFDMPYDQAAALLPPDRDGRISPETVDRAYKNLVKQQDIQLKAKERQYEFKSQQLEQRVQMFLSKNPYEAGTENHARYLDYAYSELENGQNQLFQSTYGEPTAKASPKAAASGSEQESDVLSFDSREAAEAAFDSKELLPGMPFTVEGVTIILGQDGTPHRVQ